VDQRICYVSMPFGRKMEPGTGRIVDFDAVYYTLIKPATEMAGLQPQRGDELAFGGIVHKGVLEMVIASDIFIADLTTLNPNVMYEVGIRHALRRGATVLLASRDTRLPYNISYSRYIAYDLTDDGQPVADIEDVRRKLAAAIEETGARNDSPIHEFFPDLHVELPESFGVRGRRYPRTLRKKLASRSAPGTDDTELKAIEEDLKTGPDVDPAAVLDVLKRYRDAADWNGVIRFAEEIQEPVRSLPQVAQIVALALNRRAETGDRERAIALMRDVIEKTGGDSETYGIVGHIYKDRHSQTGDPHDLRKATEAYRAAFEKQPTDYYAAINLIALLAEMGDEASAQEMAELLPRARRLVMDRLGAHQPDFWELATAVQLSVLAHDWAAATELGSRMRDQAGAPWMLESALRSVRTLGERAIPAQDLHKLDALIHELRPEPVAGE
jgi:hypothetical protein